MVKEELALLIERNRVVSRYLGAESLEGILGMMGISLDDAGISETHYSVGALFAMQPGISPSIMDCIRRGVWDANSNKFFERGQKVDFTMEPIIVLRYEGSRRYIAVGCSRAKHVYNTQGPDAQIPAIDVNHPSAERYICSIESTLGQLKRMPEL